MKFLQKENLSKIVFFGGSTRSGKIILSRIISSLERSENIRVDHVTEQFPILNRLGQLTDEGCSTMLKYSINLLTYDNFIGRNSNFKYTDFTSIWKTPNPKKYFDRLRSNTNKYGDSKEGDNAIREIKKKDIIFNMMVHYELMHIGMFIKTFPKCYFYNMIKNPIDLVYSWSKKNYSNEFLKNIRNSTLMIKYKNKYLPYYAIGCEEIYINSKYDVDKIIYMIKNSHDISNREYNKLTSIEKKRVKSIFFDDLVIAPDKIIDKICKDLNTQRTDYTYTVLSEEKCPRNLNELDRVNKLKYIKKNTSQEAFKVLERLNKEYLNNYKK